MGYPQPKAMLGLRPRRSGPGAALSRPVRSCGGRADPSQTLYVRIVQEWAATLTGPFDWADWPLDHYVFGEAFTSPLSTDGIS
jgi:hypothetical protein